MNTFKYKNNLFRSTITLITSKYKNNLFNSTQSGVDGSVLVRGHGGPGTKTLNQKKHGTKSETDSV